MYIKFEQCCYSANCEVFLQQKLTKLAGKIWRLLPSPIRIAITRATQHKFTASAAAIVRNEWDQVLLLDHVLRPGSGWGLPGGFITPNEQAETALRRELMEETGLELTEIRFYRVRVKRRHIEMLFTARATGEGRVLTREITQVRWFDRTDIPPELNREQQRLINEIYEANI